MLINHFISKARLKTTQVDQSALQTQPKHAQT